MAELEIKSRLLTRSLVLSSGTLVRPPEMQKVKQARRNGPVLIRRALAGSEYLKYLAAEPLSSHTSDLLFLQRFLQRLCPISRTHFLGGREGGLYPSRWITLYATCSALSYLLLYI